MQRLVHRRGQALFFDIQGHDELGLTANGVVGDHQHIAAIQSHRTFCGAFGVLSEDAFEFHSGAC